MLPEVEQLADGQLGLAAGHWGSAVGRGIVFGAGDDHVGAFDVDVGDEHVEFGADAIDPAASAADQGIPEPDLMPDCLIRLGRIAAAYSTGTTPSARNRFGVMPMMRWKVRQKCGAWV